MTAPSRDTVGVCKDVVYAKSGREDVFDKAFLCLAFDKNVEPDQLEGLPPTIFFSHNSDSV